ncbi:hypothetical protein [Sphingobium yanoikuyae]|uniref:DUF551 domain-containing protein n=1 Tax=Sphingobium yanoikuyae TaxID=13690 RepID=A0A3G2UUK7_SPHYA|nr:hypothetical protein [Sphingobium yanoikuyae]AYO76419.1 hypothetical protein EBF16_05360 [Sphingobium yanoikuyae]
MGRIDWIPIEDIPDRLKDGRDVLFWSNDEAVIAIWDRFLDGEDDYYEDWATREGGNLIGATHFAEINVPDCLSAD